MSAKYLLPALAIAGRAAAQCSAATTTIQNAGDASALASCQTFTGSIAIATGTTDQIALNGIQKITGSLSATNVTQITQISADSLAVIQESFTLTDLTILSSLNFPRLVTVNAIDWNALPALQGLAFTTNVQEANSVSIQNTQLASLDGINLQVVDTVVIVNNNYLNDITMQLGNISTALTIGSNGMKVQATFPNLEWAYNMTFRNCSSVSIPSLASLNGSLGFYSNNFQSLSAPNLTSVGGTLTFDSNTQLSNISMPQLKIVSGGLQVNSNDALPTVDGFPSLVTVGGALNIDGAFTDVMLPKLGDVRGAFNITSSRNIDSTCNHFQPLASANNIIKGTYTCNSGGSGSSSGSGGSGSGGSSTSGSSSSSSSASAAHMVKITGATGLMGVVAAMFGML